MAKYSLDFKMKVVVEYLSDTIGYGLLGKKYKIKSSSQIEVWDNAYQAFGIEGLKGARQNKKNKRDKYIKYVLISLVQLLGVTIESMG
ncbi:helix-turn-helix domain-containing protein [Eremococcus coleocola]|uniref:helix-turn-helix domain-containing protein n=1 Tax=Eremococcus coleocola TaxID=88132 RepID=UPI0004006E55|nr:helix-turn-helix domain-containing protein [Eremococcus coleocola]